MVRRASLTLACLLIASGAWYAVSFAGSGADPIGLDDIALDVECNGGACQIRVVVTREGRRIMSGPLPFDAIGAEIEPMAMSETFGHLLPGQKPRAVAAWSVGPDEEKAVGVAVEVAETGVAGPVLIVHQVVGFDHVKRAHVILAPDAKGLNGIGQYVEGAGPEILILAPVEAGIGIQRIAPDKTVTRQSFDWQAGPDGLNLVPKQ